jgi:hypothetical protein
LLDISAANLDEKAHQILQHKIRYHWKWSIYLDWEAIFVFSTVLEWTVPID